MRSSRLYPLVLLAALVGAALFVFYGPDPSAIPSFAALLLIPAGIGALISQIADPRGEQSPMGCFVWPTVGLLGAIAFLWVVAKEGAICIAMILPLWLPAAIAGALVQQINRRRSRRSDSDPNRFLAAGWLVLPLISIPLEQQFPQHWETRTVTREILIDSNPDQVWPLLVSIPDVRPDEGRWNATHNLLGVPRPSDAELLWRGGEMVRLARWDRGIRFEERITRFVPGQQICWDFAFPDKSVQRETDRHISPDGPFLKIRSGCYALEQDAGGQTRVRLSTTYDMRVRLGSYFTGWGELLLGDVQANILQVIADRT